MALAAAAFVAVAASHEALLALELAVQTDCGHRPQPAQPGQGHHQDPACAFCQISGAPSLLAVDANLPLLQVFCETEQPDLYVSPAVCDESAFAHPRRGPPSRPLA